MCGSPAARSCVWQNAATTGSSDFRARAGDGWARSQWDERTPIHVGPDKVHLKVKFSRCPGRRLLARRLRDDLHRTRQDGHWGIQARSSFAS